MLLFLIVGIEPGALIGKEIFAAERAVGNVGLSAQCCRPEDPPSSYHFTMVSSALTLASPFR